MHDTNQIAAMVFGAGFLLTFASSIQAAEPAVGENREPIIGLPCEGCEAVFQGLPESLSWKSRIAPEDEPGEPARIHGTVYDPSGKPAPGVIVYAYHTDSRGIYPRDERLKGQAAYRHGRLRGWVISNAEGRYQFDTIRPASYPDGKTPAHVHMHVIEKGCCTYYIDSIHFEDDVRLTRKEREESREGRGGSGVVQPTKDQNGVWIVSRDIFLGKNVPGYSRHARAGSAPTQVSAQEGGTLVSPRDERFLITEPEWGRDGKRIVFAGGAWPDLDIYTLELGSGRVEPLVDSPQTDYTPSWSPDGGRIVFASTRSGKHNLYLVDFPGGSVQPITRDSQCENTEPRWSPRGDWIAYRSDCDGNREIYRIRPNGSERTRLTRNPAEESEPSWAPDGRRLLFTSLRDGQPEVYLMNADGSNPLRLTTTPGGQSRRAEFSPDGSLIAFGSNRDGNEEIHVMNADGSGLRNLSRDPAREYFSRWSPDGQTLVITSNRDRERNALYLLNLKKLTTQRLFPPQ